MKTSILTSVFVVISVMFSSVTDVSSYRIAVVGDNVDNYKIPPVCEVGFVAYLPDIITKPPIACADPNEVYACAYGEARCDGRLFCGTPPCTWRCWCKSPYKRDANGKCVINCPIKYVEASLSFSPL